MVHGHRWADWNGLAGHAHGITHPVTGQLAGGADPRSGGEAVGFSWGAALGLQVSRIFVDAEEDQHGVARPQQ